MLVKLVDVFLKKTLPLNSYNLLRGFYIDKVLFFARNAAGKSKLSIRESILDYIYKLKWRVYPLLPRKKFLLYPKWLSIFLTTRCNLRCFICRPEGFKGADLKLENIYKLKEAIIHAETIELTGWGESFLYPHMEEVLNYIYSLNQKDNLIFITTNGSRLSKKMAKFLSGRIKQFLISLNAANPESYAKYMQYDFEKTLSSIREFLSELSEKDRGKIQLHFVAHTESFREIPDFVRLAHDLGINAVSVGNYLVARKEHVQNAVIHVKEEYNSVLNHAAELGSSLGVKVMARRFFEEKQGPVYNPERDCLDPFNNIFINTDGNVTPCCFAGAYSMGNVYRSGFDSVWFGEKYQKLREKRYLPPCKTCSPYLPLDDYHAHFTSYMKDSEDFKAIAEELEKAAK